MMLTNTSFFSEFCSIAVFARQTGNAGGSANCYHYDCWQYDCSQIASDGHFVYDVRKNMPDEPPIPSKSLPDATLNSTTLPPETEKLFTDFTNLDLIPTEDKILDSGITTPIPVTSSPQLTNTQDFRSNNYNSTIFNKMGSATMVNTAQTSRITSEAITSLNNEALSTTNSTARDASTNSEIFTSYGSTTFNNTTVFGLTNSMRNNQSSAFEYDSEAFVVFRSNYGILVSFAVFGFLITITTTVVMWNRLKESLRNYRYRHYRKIEYLVNDRSYA